VATLMRMLLSTVMIITGLGSSIASANAVTDPTTSLASSVSTAVPTGVSAAAAVTTRVPASGVPTATFAGVTVAAPAAANVPTAGNITPRNTGLPGLGEDEEEEPPEPQYKWEFSGNLTGWEHLNGGRMSYSMNQVPYVDPNAGSIPSAWWFLEQRGVSGRGPGACDDGNPFYWNGGTNISPTNCAGTGADAVTRCLFDYRGGDPFSPYTQWSSGISYSTSAIWRIDQELVSLDGGETWSPTGRTRRGEITLSRRTDWGGCEFYSSGPVSTVISCLTRIGPVTYEGPLQSKGLPAKDFRAGQWKTIPETEYKSPRTIQKAGGGAWTYTTPIGEVLLTQGGKLRGYGQIPASLNLVDACQSIEMPLPGNIEIPGWGNYKFVKDIQWATCEIVNDPGFGTRNFRGCTDKGSMKDVTWAYKICNNSLVWEQNGAPLRGPNTQQNFDPTTCDPNPDCLWSNPRTGETKGGRGVPDLYVTSESGQETLVLAGAGTDPNSSAMVAADGRPVRIDTPELTMSIPGDVGASTYCPDGAQRVSADMCRVFADYTYSSVRTFVRWEAIWESYYGPCHGPGCPGSRYVNFGTDWSGTTCPNGGTMHGGQCLGWTQGWKWQSRIVGYNPIYRWDSVKDAPPAGYRDNGTRWYKDIESIDNTSNTRYTIWEVRRGSTPWAPGGVARNSNPNAGNQPFSSHLPNGASGVLSMTSPGVDKFETSTDGYPFDADELAKDPTKGSASRPLSVAGGSQWALDMELNFYKPAAQHSDLLDENRFVVRGHFQQLWNEEFTLNSVSKFKTMYTPSGASPYIGIVEGPTRTQRFEITETCSTAGQNFTVVGTRNSPN